MANLEVNPVVKRSGDKGGIFGRIFGGAAAAIAAPFTGGASLAAAPALMGAGGLVGDIADPAKRSAPTHVGNLESSLKADPGVQLAYLQDTHEALKRDPFPGSQEYLAPTENAIVTLKKRMGL